MTERKTTPPRKTQNPRSIDPNTFAGRLYNARIELNMSGQSLADSAGITNASYCRYESGLQKGVHVNTLFKLAKALDCSPIWLWCGSKSDDVIDEHQENERFNAAIDYALDGTDYEGLTFLRMWREGDWRGINDEFPDFDLNKAPLTKWEKIKWTKTNEQ